MVNAVSIYKRVIKELKCENMEDHNKAIIIAACIIAESIRNEYGEE